jgi:uncharacterized protein YndB with AHSA1/START domain
MTEPLHLSFELSCSAEHAFDVWTTTTGVWWPSDHTMCGDPETVEIEHRVGGRIYERARSGEEHDWGVVTRWDPPKGLSFTWHLGRQPRDATEVDLSFVALGPDRSRIDIDHAGWERLAAAPDVRERTRDNWAHVVEHFALSINSNGGDPS